MNFSVTLPTTMTNTTSAGQRPPPPPPPQQQVPRTGEEVVNKYDVDGDDLVSREEAQLARLDTEATDKLFATVDGDSDGQVSADEWDSFRQSQESGNATDRPGGPRPGGPPPPSDADVGALLLSLFEANEESAATILSNLGLAEEGYAKAQDVFASAS